MVIAAMCAGIDSLVGLGIFAANSDGNEQSWDDSGGRTMRDCVAQPTRDTSQPREVGGWPT